MPVEENLRKILMMLEELAQQSLQVKLLIYFIFAEGKFKFGELRKSEFVEDNYCG